MRSTLCLTCLWISVVVLCSASVALSSETGVREPVLAGAWYPGQPEQLKRMVEQFLEQAGECEVTGKLLGLVAPHAGFIYSGLIAAYAYRALQAQPVDTVVVIAPSHRWSFSGVSVYDQGGFRTPLGVLPLDDGFISALRREAGDIVVQAPEAHAQEHSVEIQVPFIQIAAPKARFVPLVMGRVSEGQAKEFSKALARTIKGHEGRVVLIASSDLSHFHNAATARKLDAVLEGHVAALDSDGLRKSLVQGDCEACGGAPIAVVMDAARDLGARHGQVLGHGHSGEVSGDNGQVVGYLAAAFTVEENDSQEPYLNKQERALLHEIAREAVKARLENREPKYPKNLPAKLRDPGAAFVTLKKRGELRGCIGHVVARLPLAETVAAMAQAAAFQDFRFRPLENSEYDDLEWEISILTPMKRINTPEKVMVGRDGMMMIRGMNQGLLLPQVPEEWGWDRAAFLDQTCRKAGMESGCWKDPKTEIYVFQAEIF